TTEFVIPDGEDDFRVLMIPPNESRGSRPKKPRQPRVLDKNSLKREGKSAKNEGFMERMDDVLAELTPDSAGTYLEDEIFPISEDGKIKYGGHEFHQDLHQLRKSEETAASAKTKLKSILQSLRRESYGHDTSNSAPDNTKVISDS